MRVIGTKTVERSITRYVSECRWGLLMMVILYYECAEFRVINDDPKYVRLVWLMQNSLFWFGIAFSRHFLRFRSQEFKARYVETNIHGLSLYAVVPGERESEYNVHRHCYFLEQMVKAISKLLGS
ncbi:hypothetical protein L6164_025094 [Bauhinia variegata]|uniref:Uncharacterized protein n=1 Tax=Bauhinia variegata TaxID=167791 RepID=A0ACB9LZI2_BAUVA|nr:hypothetical protein L6164_025094 [Bauhinia variegata]